MAVAADLVRTLRDRAAQAILKAEDLDRLDRLHNLGESDSGAAEAAYFLRAAARTDRDLADALADRCLEGAVAKVIDDVARDVL